ncbi:MAG: hypothetical protein IPL35_12160 [Sphingobacteriales bacterium]|nr:hypothetical protein [Sphingobacteriales bacterium]
MGNIQWQREVGLLGYFSGGGQVFPYTDSTFLAHATTTRPWEDDPNYYDYQFYFAEYRYNNPEPLWEIRNDVPDKGSLYTASPKLIRLNDGNFLGKFHEDDETVFPLLMKLDSSTFEVLWQKGMTLDSTAQNYWYDIEKTPDNGIIVCGFQYSSPQTSWVVKFDQHGNTCALGTDSTYLYPCLWQQQDYGDACDDHNPVTYNDTVLSDCTCVGEYECPDLQNSIGFACDDGNPYL